MADQQYCLRWNNHQSTLISVFDSLQERGCMVDCTLAAEGQSLEAHKVVLSACSPYLEDLLSKHYDKHPILLLKDVKFSELKAIIDYMYRGEVNVAQDKLGTFLQAAESLQIKGLSECGGREPPNTGGSNSFQSAAKRTVKGIPVVGGGKFSKNLEQRRQPNPSLEVQLDGSTDDCSVSPNLRKRRKQQESQSDDGVDFDAAGNALESSVLSPAVAPASTICATSKEILPAVPISKVTDSSLRMMSSDKDISCDSFETDDIEDAIVKTPAMTLEENVIKEKLEHSSELLIEPKLEYEDEEDEHDLTHEGDGIENSVFRPGPSHPRQSGYQTLTSNDQDEVFIAAQEAAGISGDAQGNYLNQQINFGVNLQEVVHFQNRQLLH